MTKLTMVADRYGKTKQSVINKLNDQGYVVTKIRSTPGQVRVRPEKRGTTKRYQVTYHKRIR